MNRQEMQSLACELSGLSVFRGILEKKPMAALLGFLKCQGEDWEKTSLLGELVSSLKESDYCFSDFLSRAVCEDENPYIQSAAGKRPACAALEKNAQAELNLFSRLTRLSAQSLRETLNVSGYVPEFENRPVDFQKVYAHRMENISRLGYGVFAAAGMFRLSGETILPVEAPDPVSLNQFVGYEAQREKILENTRALVEGRPAANALLCGDAGTGKSSTVKACANAFFSQGVRLIEIRKDQLFSLSYVMGRIAENPLKFILFIDDLSFNKNDDSFSMLKAALEGSASARAQNAVIYATSNRRHIVKEHFSDRAESDDVHHSDTVQELLSLSDRFGLTVYFEKPAKKLYLDIVHELAGRYGVEMEEAQLDLKAEAFALARGSRSPRAAEQFVRSLM